MKNENLARHTIKIKAKGPVAWAVAIGAITAVVGNIIATVASGGTTSVVTVPGTVIAGTGVASVLGLSTAIAAMKIAVSAKGVDSLEKLRKDYIIKDLSNMHLILVKKS